MGPAPVAGAPVAPAAPPRSGVASLAARVLVTLLGAAGLIIGSFMKWFQGAEGTKISMKMYVGSIHPTAEMIRSAGAVTILIGLVAVLGLAPRSGWLTRLAGALGIVAMILFAIQVFRAPSGTLTDVGLGAWLVLAGSLVALIGGFFGTRYRVVYSGPAAVQTTAA